MVTFLRGFASCGLLFYIVASTHAATVTYDFDIGWVTANPDGAFERPVMGINGQWPIPQITANVGDRVIVNVVNNLGDQSTGLHFHGLFQRGTPHMDGPVGVTQCPIAPGASFRYDFKVGHDRGPLMNTAKLSISRSNNPGRIGIIPTRPVSIRTVYAEH